MTPKAGGGGGGVGGGGGLWGGGDRVWPYWPYSINALFLKKSSSLLLGIQQINYIYICVRPGKAIQKL